MSLLCVLEMMRLFVCVQVTDMVSEKKEGIAVLENKLKRLEVNIEHKRHVSSLPMLHLYIFTQE